MPESLYVVGCAAENMQPDGVCTVPVWVPYHQPVLPPLDLADGTLVAFAIVALWAIGLKARLVFRAARLGVF
ncbi:hypothetical protein [Pseudoxanthomonas putridarboris]|uniref:Uncharacterized protein n=1 Tax=Pseudoxanthomonas putridarboris TaxID=752605 RepID=A0ABU9IZK9_9GAMM